MTHNPEEAEIARRADAYLAAAQKMTKAKGVKYLARVADDDPEAFAAMLGQMLDDEADNG